MVQLMLVRSLLPPLSDKALGRVQALAVRAEETEEVPVAAQQSAADAINQARKLPSRFCELPER